MSSNGALPFLCSAGVSQEIKWNGYSSVLVLCKISWSSKDLLDGPSIYKDMRTGLEQWVQFTSWKLCWVNLSAMRSSSRQECVSAKALMPRQLEGSSCLLRNSQQASWISASCSRQAAGRRVCTFPSSTVTWEPGGRTLEADNYITMLQHTSVPWEILQFHLIGL